MLMNIWQFNMLNWQGVGPVRAISISFVYTRLLVSPFPLSHKLNLTYCLKSSLLLAFLFLFVCMINKTQMYPSSISPLALLQGIIPNSEKAERGDLGALNYWGGPQTPLHIMYL